MNVTRRQLFTQTWVSQHCEWIVTSLADSPTLLSLRGSAFLIAISLRNPRFSNRWLRAAVSDALELGGELRICLVDTPYFERLEQSSTAANQRTEQLKKMYRESKEKEQQIANVLGGLSSEEIEVFRWKDVEEMVPLELFDELRLAFSKGMTVYSILCDQVRSSTELETIGAIEEASVFLLREIPVLTFIYYSLFPGTIDVYPGPQAEFFWALESRVLQEELPLTTEMAANAPPSVYAFVREREN